MIWTLIHFTEYLLWLCTAGSVLYVIFFTIASFFHKKEKKETVVSATRRFLVIIPAYHEDCVIQSTVRAILSQDYPANAFCVAVVSDHMSAQTNQQLSEMPIQLLQPQFENSSKAKALQYAIAQCEANFDYVVILDADNIVRNDFLTRLNAICEDGYQAIQCHRTAKNNDNEIAALDGISEEINNTLFRRAHNAIGLSSALIGSGMCFSYAWFRDHVGLLNSAVEDRELETHLLLQSIYIKYVDGIHVMDEKVSSQENFQRQRLRWMTGQLQSFFQMLPLLPQAIRKGNINYIDKTIQQMLIPRSILLIFIPFMAVVLTLLSPPWSLKWWYMFACLCLALFLAIPAALRTRSLLKPLSAFPRLAWRMTKNLRHIDRNNKEFIHTTHNK